MTNSTSPQSPLPVAIIGAGPMGLACAYELLKQGHSVIIYEAANRIGGMSVSFPFAGIDIERFFHFICRTDDDYFQLLKELGIEGTLQWSDTKMGYFYQGKMMNWGDPLSLLSFSPLSFIDKVRYAALVMYCKNVKDWSTLDNVPAHQWLQKWLGQRAYQVLWEKLFTQKFYEFAEGISASWIGARIQRVGNSRRSLLQESLGYLQGGSETLVNALEQYITKHGGQIKISSPVIEVVTKNNQVTGIKTADGITPVAAAISTVPFPYVSPMVPELPSAEKQQIESITNIGVATVIIKLKQRLTPYFWTNINDSRLDIPGVIEYSNLNPSDGNHILYIPYYMPQSHEKYRWNEQQFTDEACQYLSMLNPQFSHDWIEALTVSRYHYAQTICEPGHSKKIPPLSSRLNGFFLADTSSYYPQDRCINDSIRVGRLLASTYIQQKTS